MKRGSSSIDKITGLGYWGKRAVACVAIAQFFLYIFASSFCGEYLSTDASNINSYHLEFKQYFCPFYLPIFTANLSIIKILFWEILSSLELVSSVHLFHDAVCIATRSHWGKTQIPHSGDSGLSVHWCPLVVYPESADPPSLLSSPLLSCPLPAAVCCSRSALAASLTQSQPAGSWRENPPRERNRFGRGEKCERVCGAWVCECVYVWLTKVENRYIQTRHRRTLKLRRRGTDT